METLEYRIRPAVIEDKPNVHHTLANIVADGHRISNSFDPEWYVAHYANRLQHSHLNAVAETSDGTVIGAVMVEPLTPEYAQTLADRYNTRPELAVEFGGMFVHPAWRGQGVAKRLVTAMADLAAPHGYTLICAIEPGNPASNASISSAYQLTPIKEHTFNGVDLVNYLLTPRS